LEENKILIKSFVEDVFNKHNLTAINKYLARNLTNESEKTPESFNNSLTALFSSFPDLHVTIEHIIAENNFVVVFLNFTGTHKGEFQGFQSTNKPVEIRSADLYRIENGKIVEHWDVVDQMDFLQQTGALLSSKTEHGGV
jgi:predicted ester cyclase